MATQDELEAYRGCTTITGSLQVTGACSLAPLASLVSIEGSLTLGGGEQESPALAITSLAGLGALVTVGRNLQISGAPALGSFDGLDALTQVGADFEISMLPVLVRLHGPGSLVDVGGDLSIRSLAALELVDGFDALTSVGANAGLRNFSGVRFSYDDALHCVGGFPVLTSTNEIELEHTLIEAVPGLTTALVTSAPRLRLMEATGFDLLTLPPLDSLAGLDMVRGPSLPDLSALAGITSLGSLRLIDTTLQSLGGLDALVSVDEVDLSDNAELVDVSALDGVGALGTVRLDGDQAYDARCAFAGATEAGGLAFARTGYDVIPWPRSIARIGALAIAENHRLAELGSVELTVGDAVVANNAPITNAEVASWLQTVVVEGTAKYGGNAGVLLEPCPWRDDGVCDLGLCAEDSAVDCPPVE